jgi:hypothetical protein
MEVKMSITIAVIKDGDSKEGGWKVLVNYIQRGITYNSMQIANSQAVEISEHEHYDHLILAKEEA